ASLHYSVLLLYSFPPAPSSLLFLMIPRPPRSPLFPYTTLFRSGSAEDSPGSGANGCTSSGSIEMASASALVSGETFVSSPTWSRSEEHTSELQSLTNLVCRLLLEKKKRKTRAHTAPRTEYCSSH